jgi:hypothetical protein
MELLNRYLQAVKFWLPRAQQDDIIAELREDLRSQIDERERSLGRALNEAELEALLKQRGRPLLVAGQYLPQQSLIGPLFFPAYLFVLKLAAVCYLVPWVLVWIGLVVFSPAYRAVHLGPAIAGDLFVLWLHALTVFSVVTITFATLDQATNKSKFLSDWTPRKLPPARDHYRIPRASSGFELVMGGFLGIWFLIILWTLTVVDMDGFKITLTAPWHRIFWVFLPLWAVNTTLSAVNFVRPYWTPPRRLVRAAANFFAAAALALALKIQPAVLVSYGNTKVGQVVEGSIDLSLAISFAIASLVCIIVGCVDVWRAYVSSKRAPTLNHAMTAG